MFDRFKAAKNTAKALAFGKMTGDNRARMDAMVAVKLVVGLTVGGLVAAFLLPIALDELVAVDTGNYSSGAAALWSILDVIIILALFLFFIGIALAAVNRVSGN